MVKLPSKGIDGTAIFATCYDNGTIVLYKELDAENVDMRKRVIEEELCLNQQMTKKGRQSNYVSYKGGADKIV